MLSDFRKRKFQYMFDHFDSDKSGDIEKKDFELEFDKYAGKKGWSADDAIYNEVRTVLFKIWDDIQNQADTNKDGKVSLDEWLSMWEKYANNPSAAFEWQKSYCKLIFQLEDEGNDGMIDVEEFAAFYQNLRPENTAAEAKEAFKKLSQGKPGVSWDEFQILWEEYFKSDDPNAPGTFVFSF